MSDFEKQYKSELLKIVILQLNEKVSNGEISEEEAEIDYGMMEDEILY